MLSELWRKLGYLFHRRRFESDLDEELRFHLDQMPDRRKFGNTTILKEVSREMWGWGSLERLVRDIRYALRQLPPIRGSPPSRFSRSRSASARIPPFSR